MSQSGCDPGLTLRSGFCALHSESRGSSRCHLSLNSHKSTSMGHGGGSSQASGSRFSLVAPRGNMCHCSLLIEPKLECPWKIMDFLHYFKRTLPWQLPVGCESRAESCDLLVFVSFRWMGGLDEIMHMRIFCEDPTRVHTNKFQGPLIKWGHLILPLTVHLPSHPFLSLPAGSRSPLRWNSSRLSLDLNLSLH